MTDASGGNCSALGRSFNITPDPVVFQNTRVIVRGACVRVALQFVVVVVCFGGLCPHGQRNRSFVRCCWACVCACVLVSADLPSMDPKYDCSARRLCGGWCVGFFFFFWRVMTSSLSPRTNHHLLCQRNHHHHRSLLHSSSCRTEAAAPMRSRTHLVRSILSTYRIL
jgi:hypothetical protein